MELIILYRVDLKLEQTRIINKNKIFIQESLSRREFIFQIGLKMQSFIVVILTCLYYFILNSFHFFLLG